MTNLLMWQTKGSQAPHFQKAVGISPLLQSSLNMHRPGYYIFFLFKVVFLAFFGVWFVFGFAFFP